MSVLSRPQGTPERVWSLIGGLEALGGELPREEWISLLNPGYVRGDVTIKAVPSLAGDSPGAAYALGLTDREGSRVRLSLEDRPADLLGFADEVHDILCRTGTGEVNAVILEAYAWLVAEGHRRSDIGWLYDVGREEFADLANSALVGEDEDGRLMNATKATAWRRWLRFLGLGVPMPGSNTIDFPSPARRMAIELSREGVASGTVMAAEDFVALLARRCPYLDRGRQFVQACQRIGHTPSTRSLSPILCCGLRDLQFDGVIALHLTGDAADGLSLGGDPSAVQATFTSVVMLGTEADA